MYSVCERVAASFMCCFFLHIIHSRWQRSKQSTDAFVYCRLNARQKKNRKTQRKTKRNETQRSLRFFGFSFHCIPTAINKRIGGLHC